MMTSTKKIIIFDLDDTLFDSTGQPEDTGDVWEIELFDGFRAILESQDYVHILVTRGAIQRQNRKIDSLGIRKYFTDIYVVDSDTDKYVSFVDIKNTFPESEIIVIGNRIDCEIRYGNLLGMKTAYIKHGKYKTLLPKDSHELPTKDFNLNEISDLKNFL